MTTMAHSALRANHAPVALFNYAGIQKDMRVERDAARLRCTIGLMNRKRRTAALTLPFLILTAQAKTPVRTSRAMVVAQEPLAADVGAKILRNGGNAIDAAVGVGFALAVTHPFAGNIGGGGFMLIRFADGRTEFIDFREAAPLKAARDMYVGPDGKTTRESLEGWRASGVPGTVRGLELAHQKYGRKTWAEDIAPSVDLANGIKISERLASSLAGAKILAKFPESKRIFQNDGSFYKKGSTLRQPELAETLKRISAEGSRDFYEGETAKRFAAEMAAHGGLITLEDLKAYQPKIRKPINGFYGEYEIISAPPPSAGGIGLIQMLGMLSGTPFKTTGYGSGETAHYLAEAMRRFYADRAKYLGDPDFANVPTGRLVDPAYIAERRGTIKPDRATPSSDIFAGAVPGYESDETTHYAVVDEQGTAVAVTYTLNGGYGSGVTVPGLGFLLNNEMDDFAAKPGVPNLFGLVQGEANAIQPGKRPLSSMTPTIILKNGKLYLIVGAPGGSRITTAVMQVIVNVLDFGMNAQEAVSAPRIHHQWMPDQLFVESKYSKKAVKKLLAYGHKIDPGKGPVLARVEAIRVLPDGKLEGGSDPRGGGKAAGY
jgi:gamma-glutamyltranspeptidase/glutathione hydrolase